MADTATISRFRGDTYPIRIYLKDSTGAALPVTGCSFLMTVNANENPDDIDDQVFQIVGVVYGDGTAGIVDFEVDAVNADHLGKFYYDVQMTDALNHQRTILKGAFRFTQDITK